MKDAENLIKDYVSSYTCRNYSAGEIIVFANEVPRGLFYIKSGQIKQYAIDAGGNKLVVNRFKPGAFVPLEWVFTDSKQLGQFFYEAVFDSELIIVSPDSFIDFVKDNKQVAFYLLSGQLSNISRFNEKMVRLMDGSAYALVVWQLIVEADRFARHLGSDRYELNIHEYDLADSTGLSRETVSRNMQLLKSRELISIKGHRMTIESLDRLKQELN